MSLFSSHRIGAQRLRLVRCGSFGFRTVRGQLACIVAFRIVGATDKSTIFAELQRKIAGAANLTDARIGTVLALGEDQRCKNFVQRIQHVGDAQFLGIFDLGEEILPEITQNLLPVQFAGGDAVELFFKGCGEIVFDVFGEEAFEESRHQPAARMRYQLAFVDDDIFAVAQRFQRRRIGGRTADAEALPSS